MEALTSIYKFRRALQKVGAEVCKVANRLGPAEVMRISAVQCPSFVGRLLLLFFAFMFLTLCMSLLPTSPRRRLSVRVVHVAVLP
jgi:hypothetical protein